MNRDQRDGRYTFSGDMSRLCKCGHTLGVHAAAAPHDCFHGTGAETPRDPGNLCNCQKFRIVLTKRRTP